MSELLIVEERNGEGYQFCFLLLLGGNKFAGQTWELGGIELRY
jgi:hypothetical protein